MPIIGEDFIRATAGSPMWPLIWRILLILVFGGLLAVVTIGGYRGPEVEEDWRLDDFPEPSGGDSAGCEDR